MSGMEKTGDNGLQNRQQQSEYRYLWVAFVTIFAKAGVKQ